MSEEEEIKKFEAEILAYGRGADYIDLEPVPENLDMEKAGNHWQHMLVGYREGEIVADEPFDEIRLVENADSGKPLKYKGKL